MAGFRKTLPWLLLSALLAFIAWKLHTSHFDWVGFAQSWRRANLKLVLLAIAVIYCNYVLRALRWGVFLRPSRRKAGGESRVSGLALTGTQFVGFTGLALFGRVGELIRPILIARRTGLSVSSQIAVVAVERIFDLGAFALIFSLNLVFARNLETLPHHELFHRVGYAIAGLTLTIAGFVLAVRLAGAAVARVAQKLGSLASPQAGEAAAEKILAFREGLDVIDSVPDFLWAALLSLATWSVIALSYVLALKAFPPPISQLSVSHALLLMGFSIVGGVVQLPGVGGGAQALTIGALTTLFGIPAELAVSAGLMIWLITNMSVIPAGLVYARIEGISLRQTAHRSEDAEAAILDANNTREALLTNANNTHEAL